MCGHVAVCLDGDQLFGLDQAIFLSLLRDTPSHFQHRELYFSVIAVTYLRFVRFFCNTLTHRSYYKTNYAQSEARHTQKDIEKLQPAVKHLNALTLFITTIHINFLCLQVWGAYAFEEHTVPLLTPITTPFCDSNVLIFAFSTRSAFILSLSLSPFLCM